MGGSKKYAILLLIAGGALLVLILYRTIVFVSEHIETALAREDARSYAKIISDVQVYYATEVVAHAKKNGIKIAKDYKKRGDAIPYPATFTHGLADKLNAKYGDLNFRLYSDAPFYERPRGDGLSAFDREALEHFRKTDENEIYRIEAGAAGPQFRFARAVRMGESCVECHNSHPDSPRKDWKVGDVRGVQRVAINLPGPSFMNDGYLNPPTVVVALLCFIVMVSLFLLLFVITKYNNERSQRHVIKIKNAELQRAKENIEQFAFFDSVTTLPNRTYFQNHMAKLTSDDSGQSNEFCLLILDLDHFKSINDRYSHIIGDNLLRIIGQRISDALHGNDFVARLSGDEFAAVLHGSIELNELQWIVTTIIDTISQSTEIQNVVLTPSVSIGISRYPQDGQSFDQLLSCAGLALNKAKNRGRNTFCIFDNEFKSEIRHKDSLEAELKNALSDGELEVYYQPKVCLSTGGLEGFEALLRWIHPTKGEVTPDSFLPIAEERGLIMPICELVARRVAMDMQSWDKRELCPGNVAINIHADQLKNLEEMDRLVSLFDDYGIPAERITLEITEDCVVGRGTESIPDILRKLVQRGCRISLDDFGTGFASLTHLKNLPVHEVKIDRSFVSDIAYNKESVLIVRSIVELSQKLGMSVVAEGIETMDQLTLLKYFGCCYGQGYLFLPPSPAAVTDGLLNLHEPFNGLVSHRPNTITDREYDQLLRTIA